MIEILSDLRGEELVALFFFAAIGIVFLVCVLVTAWQKHRDRELAVLIIQDMLDQGMSVDQIERVLEAAGFNADKTESPTLARMRSAQKDAGEATT